jgi:hypothetical protein
VAASGAPPAAAQSPQALHQLPHEVAAPIVSAYADSLDRVFLYAAPVAVVGFVVALCLKQVPLRNTNAASSIDLGEGFAMPSASASDELLENAVGRLLRQSAGVHLRTLARRRDIALDPAGLWALMQVYRFSQAVGEAQLRDIAELRRVPQEILEPAFDRLVAGGYAQRGGDAFWLTPAGAQQVERVRNIIVDWLTQMLNRSPTFDYQPDRAKVHAALERIVANVLVEREWTDDATALIRNNTTRSSNTPTRPMRAVTLQRPSAAPTRPMPALSVRPAPAVERRTPPPRRPRHR